MSDVLSELKSELSVPLLKVYSGIEAIDNSTGGFKASQTFVVAGLKKSGKSSLLMNFVDFMIKKGERVGFLNTELPKIQFFQRMSSIANDIFLSDAENHPTYPVSWYDEVKENFFYAEKQDIKDSYGLSIAKTIAIFKEWVCAGAKVIVLDNLTTFNTVQPGSIKRGWEVLAHALDTLIDFAKENNIVLFVVIHTKDHLVFTETPMGIQKLLENKTPEKIFDKSITVNRRPTSGDIFGGGAAKSQISGGILLLWRPYQDFSLTEYQRMTLLILEDFRDGVRNNEIRLEFDGSKLRFEEFSDKTFEQAKEIFKPVQEEL